MSAVFHYSDQEMVSRAIANAKPKLCGVAPRWVAVMDTFGLGSTYAHDLCRVHGLNPDEPINGARCLSCSP